MFVSKFEESWKNEHVKNYLLKIIELTEQEQEIIGVSPHLLGVAIK